MAKVTAESKLLKLIEETDAKDAGSNPGVAANSGTAVAPEVGKVLNSVSTVGVGSISIPPFLQKIFVAFSSQDKPAAGSGLRLLNRILIVVILLLGIFFMKDFSKGIQESKSVVSAELKHSS